MYASLLLPQQNEMWLQRKIKPLWQTILSKNNISADLKEQSESLLDKLNKSFYYGKDKILRDKIDNLNDDIKNRWVDLAYREINKNTNGMIKGYIELLDNLNLAIPRRRYSLRNFIYLKGLTRIFHESLAATTDMAVLPGVLGCRPLRRTVQVRLGTNSLWLPGGTPIFVVSRQQFMKYPG